MSLEAILDWIGLIQCAKFNEEQIRAEGRVGDVANALLSTYRTYVQRSTYVHGMDWAISKTHWNWHVNFQHAVRGRIYDTFSIERLHRRVKPFSRVVENTQSFERSVLTKLVAFQCKEGYVDQDNALAGAEQPISPYATAVLGPCSKASSSCDIAGECAVFSGDFIRSAGKCATVAQAVTCGHDDSVRIICRVWSSTSQSSNFWDMLRITDHYEAWDPDSAMVVLPLAWRMLDAANAVVLWRP